MSFRTSFASRLREVQEQAKEAVQNLELPKTIPTFDDMAARDEYIHSEEFNVRGQPRLYKTKSNDAVNGVQQNRQQLQQPSYPEQRQGTTMDNDLDDEALSSHFGGSVSTASSSPAWSLLDQPSTEKSRKAINSDDSPTNENKEASAFSKVSHLTLTSDGRTSPAAASTLTSSKPALLSIVNDTLQDTPPVAKHVNATHRLDSLPNLGHANVRRSIFQKSDDDSLDDDENDPIMSLLHQEQQGDRSSSLNLDSLNENDNNVSILNSPATKKSSHRFMEDLEQRMQLPEEIMEAGNRRSPTFDGLKMEPDPSNQQQQSSAAPYFTRGPFGGAVLNMAMRNFQRIVTRSDINEGTSPQPPPLARERLHKVALKRPEEDFHVKNSDSVLTQAELEALKKPKCQGSLQAVLMQALHEHRNYLFIAFTMILAIYVYFLTHKKLEDDVT
jgi:hypothetical protein